MKAHDTQPPETGQPACARMPTEVYRLAVGGTPPEATGHMLLQTGTRPCLNEASAGRKTLWDQTEKQQES